jgi:hypothetical protein
MSGFNIRNNPYPSLAYRWGGGRAPGFRGLGDFLAHRGLGDDSTDVLSGTNTPDNTNIFDLMTPPPAITTSLAPEPNMSLPFSIPSFSTIASDVSSAFQQAQASMAAMFSPSGTSSSPDVSSTNIMQSFQNYLNGTATPAEVNYFTSLPTSVMNQLQNLAVGLSPSANITGGSPNTNLLSQLAQQWTNITGKILQQTTVPAGQIQITGPNGQSEIIQTSATTAGIGIPGLNVGNTSGLFSLVLLGGGIFLLVRLLEQH